MDRPTNNKTTAAGGAGGALGVLLVFFLPEVSDITFTGEGGAIVAAASGTVFAWLGRYLPKPGG